MGTTEILESRRTVKDVGGGRSRSGGVGTNIQKTVEAGGEGGTRNKVNDRDGA